MDVNERMVHEVLRMKIKSDLDEYFRLCDEERTDQALETLQKIVKQLRQYGHFIK